MNASAYTLVPLEAYAITPIHQGTFLESIRWERKGKEINKNFSPIRTTEMFTGSSGWMEIPTISGNSLRGRLRRAATIDFFNIVKDVLGTSPLDPLLNKYATLSNTDRFTLQLLLAGGSLKGKDKDATDANTDDSSSDADKPKDPPKQVVALSDTLERSEIEMLLPMLSVFGYGDGFDRMTPGSIAVTDLIPLLAETQKFLNQWDGINLHRQEIVPSWNELINPNGQKWAKFPRQAATRNDPTTAVFNSYKGVKEVRSEEDPMTQMVFTAEYLPAGIRLYGGVYLHESMSDVEKGMVYSALDRLFADGFIGGQRSRGYGRVQWNTTMMPDDKQSLAAIYQKHVKDHAQQISQIVPTLVAKRDASSQPASTSQRGTN